MSDDKYTENDPERTLITLDQLSQTIEVMTSVVNRLRQHLSEQLKAQVRVQNEGEQVNSSYESEPARQTQADDSKSQVAKQKRESFVVEISQQEFVPVRKNSKTLH